MTQQDELIAILDSILSGRRDEEDIAKLRQSLSMAGSVLQLVSQDGKFNTNIGQITGGEVYLGDRIYQGADAETIRKVFQEVLQLQSQPPDIDWYAVCKKNLEKLQKLTSNPLTQKQDLTVNAVYVPLGLVEREKKKKSERQEDINPEQGSELYKETKITKTFEHHAFLEEVLRQGKSHSQGKRIAIIGEPGAGKTTLLQRIANWVSEEIKESLVIWVSLAELGDKKLYDYLSDIWLPNALKMPEVKLQLKEAFATQFNQGRVWLLLDGLDEMPAPPGGDSLSAIAQQLKVGWVSEDRVILTCRLNLWDSNSKRKDLYEFDIFRTLDFSYPKQVEQFINQWFTATDNLEPAQKLCSALKEQNKGRLRDLVRNPLRLTLLCEIWAGKQEQGELPDTKTKLYQEFVDYHYSYKFNTTDREREELNRVLGELAKWAIEQPEFRFRIRLDQIPKHLKQDLGYKDEKSSLLGLALQLGWLNNVGVAAENPNVEVYAFFHASFQEYFAAQAIDNWHFFLDHKRRNPAQGTYLVFDSQWKEPILFWLGRDGIENKHKDAFIRTLVNFRDAWQGYYQHQAYFLAAAGIAEFRDCARVNEIVGAIVEWSLGSILSTAANLHPLVIDGARVALKETDRETAIFHLIETIKFTKESKFTHRELVIEGTNRYNKRSYYVQKTIEKNYPKPWAAIRILGEIGTGSHKDVKNTLEGLIKDTTKDFTRLIAAESLIKLEPGNSQAKDARQKAVNSLMKSDLKEPAEIEELIALLETPTDEFSRRIFSVILKLYFKKLYFGKPALDSFYFLLDILGTTTDESICRIAGDILKKAIQFFSELTKLSDLARKEGKDEGRKRKEEDLKRQKQYFIQELDKLINSNDEFVRQKTILIIKSLEEKDIIQSNKYGEKFFQEEEKRNEIIQRIEKIELKNAIKSEELEELVAFIKDAKDEFIRRKAASTLEKMASGNSSVIGKLFNIIKTTEDAYIYRIIYVDKAKYDVRVPNRYEVRVPNQGGYIRLEAARTLWKVSPDKRSEVTEAFIEIIKTTVDESARREAIEALEEFSVVNPKVTDALTDLMKKTRDGKTRLTAARSLWKRNPNTDNRQALNILMKKGDYETLYRLAQSLAYPVFHEAWLASGVSRYFMWARSLFFELVKSMNRFLNYGKKSVDGY